MSRSLIIWIGICMIGWILFSSYTTVTTHTDQLIINPWGYQSWRGAFAQAQWPMVWWIYQITWEPALTTLMKAGALGTRIIIENKPYAGNPGTYYRARDQIRRIWSTQNDDKIRTKYVHAKTFVRQNQAIIQTFNLSQSSFRNREFAYVTSDQHIIRWLQELFEADRRGKPLDRVASWLVVCPINCLPTIQNLITWAKKSIDIYNQYITNSSLISLLDTSKVTRRIILSATDQNKAQRSGTNYIQWLEKPYVHAKMMLIDDSILLLSSINRSDNSLLNNREIGVIITNPQIIRQFITIFDQDRKASRQF